MTKEQPTVQMTKEELVALIAAAVAAAKPTKTAKGEKAPKKLKTEEEKQASRDKTDAATLANFKAKGYQDVQPRINVKTFNKWIEVGRRVKRGEKSTICGSFALFHVEQTEAITIPEDVTKH